ncbi:MAG TPA: hypothetical protein VFB16_07720 [Bauldia sp.]|nr:hypothetical protein [Bauldia sp.]
MDIDVARHMIRAAFRTSRELEGVLQFLKEICPDEEYRPLALGIAAAIDRIGIALIEPAEAAHPELRAETEASIARYGRYL